jgi:hypothetical protein
MPDMPDQNQNAKNRESQSESADGNFWADAEIISIYSRAQALEDGFLVNVSELAHEAGFRCPVAITSALWADIENIPVEDQGVQDTTGRLWDVLFVGVVTARRLVAQGFGGSDRMDYQIFLTLPDRDYGKETLYPIKMVIGAGDDGEPVFTLMKPNED